MFTQNKIIKDRLSERTSVASCFPPGQHLSFSFYPDDTDFAEFKALPIVTIATSLCLLLLMDLRSYIRSEPGPPHPAEKLHHTQNRSHHLLETRLFPHKDQWIMAMKL